MPKILTRAEAHAIGGSGTLIDSLRCCTRAVAESYGCVVSSSYSSNQLISRASAPEPTEPIYRPERIIIDITDNNDNYLQYCRYYQLGDWTSSETIDPDAITVRVNNTITATLDEINSNSNNYLDVASGEGTLLNIVVSGPSNTFSFNVSVTSGGIGTSLGSTSTSSVYDLDFTTPGVPQFFVTNDIYIQMYQECQYQIKKTIVQDPTSANGLAQKIQIQLLGNRFPYIYLYQKSGSQELQSFLCPTDEISSSTYDTVSGFIRVTDRDDTGEGHSLINVGQWNQTICGYRMYVQSDGLNAWDNKASLYTVGWLNWWDQKAHGVVKNSIGIDKDIFYETVFSEKSYSTSKAQINPNMTDMSLVSMDKSVHNTLTDMTIYKLTRGEDNIIRVYLQGKEEQPVGHTIIIDNPEMITSSASLYLLDSSGRIATIDLSQGVSTYTTTTYGLYFNNASWVLLTDPETMEVSRSSGDTVTKEGGSTTIHLYSYPMATVEITGTYNWNTSIPTEDLQLFLDFAGFQLTQNSPQNTDTSFTIRTSFRQSGGVQDLVYARIRAYNTGTDLPLQINININTVKIIDGGLWRTYIGNFFDVGRWGSTGQGLNHSFIANGIVINDSLNSSHYSQEASTTHTLKVDTRFSFTATSSVNDTNA